MILVTLFGVGCYGDDVGVNIGINVGEGQVDIDLSGINKFNYYGVDQSHNYSIAVELYRVI